MYEYIEGKIADIGPAHVVVDNSGLAYFISISLNTYSELSAKREGKIFLHHIVREDAQLLFGFATKTEREIFRQLISVSGVGPNTARMILSSMNPDQIVSSIIQGNHQALKNVKGIGQKTAERIVVDLKDKFGKVMFGNEIISPLHNTNREEALSALIMLGFARNNSEKVIDKLMTQQSGLSTEELVKMALKQL